MAVPTLLYDSETWTMNSQTTNRIQTAEMRFLRAVKHCTILDKIRSEDIRKELQIYSLNGKITDYRIKWRDHVRRMPSGRLPRAVYYYQPEGKRDCDRPVKRWADQEAGTGCKPNP
ncbi:uncharacterized protein LOC129220111 [Uloborus diversus]|uniref:uncharacterized protein LOC129220111 n=1 Tax=Uloborus diversus TaxID=327109 RepID=UPI0024091A3F|nr:uncharacterized protein LOC129220111 [Uloborus diversus]